MKPPLISQPIFSIIIPTYARPDRLAQCLGSLVGLDYLPGDFEVIVVDDGSPNRSAVGSAVEPYQDRLRLKFIRQSNAGPAAARNKGAMEASGRYLAFVDDDCRPDRSWLTVMERRLAGSVKTVIGGRTINGLRENLFSSASQMLVTYQYEYYNSDPERARFLASNNLALPKEVFDRIGGFDTGFSLAGGEDREFCARLIATGHDLIYLPEALVHHFHQLSLSGFWRQNYNYGRGARLLRRNRTGSPSFGAAGFQPLGFYLDLIRYPLTIKEKRRPVAASLLMIVSQLAIAHGYFKGGVLPEG